MSGIDARMATSVESHDQDQQQTRSERVTSDKWDEHHAHRARHVGCKEETQFQFPVNNSITRKFTYEHVDLPDDCDGEHVLLTKLVTNKRKNPTSNRLSQIGQSRNKQTLSNESKKSNMGQEKMIEHLRQLISCATLCPCK